MSDGEVGASGSDADDTTGPPVLLLVAAALCVAVGVALLFVGTFGAHLVGYAVASLLTILLIGGFRRVDLIRRLAPSYRPAPRLHRVVPMLLVGAFVVAGFHVWAIATEVAS